LRGRRSPVVTGPKKPGRSAESFFGSLKNKRLKKQIYKSRDLAIANVADYIDAFYNRTRRHGHLGGLSPEQFEAAHNPRRRRLH
jgi:putative transposase